MKINNFYPITPEVSRKLRQGKLTAAEWRIWSYLIEIDPWGDIYKDIDTLTVMAECDVSKATFYRAIAKFQELELFDIQDKGISIRNLKGVSSLKNETPVSEMRQDSQNCETRRKNETKKSKMRQDSQNCENQPPEPAPSKASEVPHTIQTYKTYTDSLSESERESFLEFGKKKASELPKPPTLISNWIKTHWEDLRSQWEKSQGKVSASQSSKWDNHPQRKEWLEKIRQLGPAGFQAEDMPNQKIRQEFYVWADANNLIWGNEA
ncbi:MAG: hypothetical protein PX483_11345 [Nostocales cyanobacterium LE14-WE4]|jgi:hypothetical protein|nr:hypothetical protein [Anabaena sp. 49633_E8]MDJ0501432.1 hypothetical protein [Nostocales cyanobacterium LE14-WE4]